MTAPNTFWSMKLLIILLHVKSALQTELYGTTVIQFISRLYAKKKKFKYV